MIKKLTKFIYPMKEREKENSVREDGEGWGCDERERERGREKSWLLEI